MIADALIWIAIAVLVLWVAAHERRVFLQNRNSSRPVVKGQKKPPASRS